MSTFIQILQLFPLIIALVEKWVTLVETDKMEGNEKKELVKKMVVESIKVMEQLPGIGNKVPWKLIEPVVGTVIDMVVMVYNLVGKFSKKEG